MRSNNTKYLKTRFRVFEEPYYHVLVSTIRLIRNLIPETLNTWST